ncbi:unnamed protein product [Mytilus coruscus]|uniref:Uncharacterized protein n=1 Tax=Mytilus coruscus TaxID=42192 RepID=A0A6J8EL20_MYTCO|nr:unnamed protein product [Mytilus coruscus]
MSRCHSLSDSESDSDHDNFDDELNDEQVLKLFASEEEIDASFSGFMTPQKSGAETSAHSGRTGSYKRNANGRYTSTGLTDSLRSTFTGNTHRDNSLQRTRQNNETARTENNHNDQYSDQEEESDYPVYDTYNNNIENGNFSIFSDDGNCNDQSEVSSDENNEFDYELPRIFQGDERFGEEVCESISKVCDNICKKKTDVSTMVNELKVPSNCKSLVVQPVNPKIWQFLDRKTKSSDLGLQNLQRLLAYGMIPVITLAGILKTKKPDIKLMREAVSKAMTGDEDTPEDMEVKEFHTPTEAKEEATARKNSTSIKAESFSTSVINTKKVQQLIQSVGFNTNMEKSVFIPSQRITFLGYIIDSVLFRVFLPEDKIQKIIEISNNVLKAQNILIRHVAQLVGLYSSARYAVTHAHLFHRYLDIDKTRALIKSK